VNQCRKFREAIEAQYQISISSPHALGLLAQVYNSILMEAAHLAGVTPHLMHMAIVKRGNAYNRARMEGYGPHHAFEIASTQDPGPSATQGDLF
jgi:hypothetical protein